MPDHSAIDQRAIAALQELSMAGSDDFLREIITLYLQDTPLLLAQLEQALAAGDGLTVSRLAHSIKGSSSNFGATQLAQLAQLAHELELAAPLGGATVANVKALLAEYASVAAALTASITSD